MAIGSLPSTDDLGSLEKYNGVRPNKGEGCQHLTLAGTFTNLFHSSFMEYKKFKHLTDEQVQCFMEHGYLRVKNCFSREASETWTKDVWMRLGFDPHDQSTWTRERTNMPEHRKIKVSEFAPKAWDAICELVGGEGRVNEKSGYWNDGFIVNLGTPEGAGKEIHPKELNGWHVDGKENKPEE